MLRRTFFKDKDKLSLPASRGKDENKGGVTFKHCTIFLSCPHLVPPFQNKEPGSPKQMFSTMADWLGLGS